MFSLYLSLFIAGFIIIITPGPVFIASIKLVSEKGRIEGLKLIAGALPGDILWLFLTCLFIIEASRLPELFFQILAIACGLYILYLAYGLYKSASDPQKAKVFKRPFFDGLALGFLNPKSYPVMVAIFSALIFDYIQDMTWADFPVITLFSVFGFIVAYLFINLTAGFPLVTKFYKKHIHVFTYFFAVIFLYFGITLFLEAF